MRAHLPAFSFLFGIHPWDVELMTVGELETYRRWQAEYMQARSRRR